MFRKFLKKILVGEKKEPFYTKDIFKNSSFEIGEHTYGSPRVLFANEKAKLKIGKFCSIAEGVNIFLGGNHRVDWISTYPFNKINDTFPEATKIEGHPDTNGDVIIGNDVWIGFNVTIMSGVRIGNGAVIGAGALVTKNIGDYEVWGGNPAKFIKNRFRDEEKKALLDLKWWDWDIKKIKDSTAFLCSKNVNSLLEK